MIRLLLPSGPWVLVSKFVSAFFSSVLFVLIQGCTSNDTSYFPLKEGQWWEYQETLVIRDESHQRRRIVTNIKPLKFDNRTIYIQETQGAKQQFFSIREAGIYREYPDSHEEELIMPAILDKDISWRLQSHLGVIESRTFALEDRILTRIWPLVLSYSVVSTDEEITVPAGRFRHCLKIQGTGTTTVRVDRGNGRAVVIVENFDWYAPGVGLIKTERTERSESPFLKTGLYTLELLKVNQS